MLPTPESPLPFNPYGNFRFRVKWDDRPVAGFSKVSALKLTPGVVDYRDDGEAGVIRPSPGLIKNQAITLERGITHDPEFMAYASSPWSRDSGSGAGSAPNDFRRDLVIELHDEAGKLAFAWKVHRACVSGCQAVPNLDAKANGLAIAHLTLEHEGWEPHGDAGDALLSR